MQPPANTQCRPAQGGRNDPDQTSMAKRPNHVEQLRRAIDCLPVRTRVAMLEGIQANDIIVGAYSTRDGGVCPMLAAHRHGGRTSFIGFAKAWDRFARARDGKARRATDRELRILATQLQASLMAEDQREVEAARDPNGAQSTAFARAIAEHRALVASRPREDEEVEWVPKPERRRAKDRPIRASRRRRAGQADVAAEATPNRAATRKTAAPSRRHGRAWLRPFRRYDDYLGALDRVRMLAAEDAEAMTADPLAREREHAGVD
jgi:hypothetical protein